MSLQAPPAPIHGPTTSRPSSAHDRRPDRTTADDEGHLEIAAVTSKPSSENLSSTLSRKSANSFRNELQRSMRERSLKATAQAAFGDTLSPLLKRQGRGGVPYCDI